MKKFTLLIVLLFTIMSSLYPQDKPKYKIAVTIDDLPLLRITDNKNVNSTKDFNKLVNEIVAQKTYVIGFVNEQKLYLNGTVNTGCIELLETWLKAGLNLGNHTYSHLNLHKVTIDEYKKDITNGEKITKELLAKYGKHIKYFRHPYLNTGLSLQVKDEVNSFLKENGYTVAPVTIDNAEWIFSKAYDIAAEKEDLNMMNKIGVEYIDYMKRKTEYWESQSILLFGRNISQVLLIHANRLNADNYPKLCDMYRTLNYEFVSLDEALKDEAYKSEDLFIRNAGISWIHRWALAKGKKKDFFGKEPACPAYIMQYANVAAE